MSTYLLTSTPAHGHVMPLLAIARHLKEAGHSILFATSPRYADRVIETGAQFIALPPEADIDLDDADGAFPERVGLRGPAGVRFDVLNLFLAPGAAQLDTLRTVIAQHRVDAILTEPLFVGAALLNTQPRTSRPPIVALGIFPLGVKSRDTAPFGLGIPPKAGIGGRMRNALLTLVAERVIFGSVQREADALSKRTVGAPVGRFFLDWHSGADALVQFTVPGFEYPRSDLSDSVRFVGPLPAPASTMPLPEWWDDLSSGRPIVHVTQGTVANSDLDQLINPTIRALADSDALVVVSTGGREVTDAGLGTGAALPSNVRVAGYVPYDRLLPLVDVMITNGGYGGVQQALSHGIPLVVAGQTEDKVEVSARVGWSGAGVDLHTNEPTPAQLAAAVARVRSEPGFRQRAAAIAAEMATAPGLAGLDAVLREFAVAAEPGPLPKVHRSR